MQARRRLFMMQSELPSAYRRVEYLEANGTQYIQTDYTPVENDEFNMRLYSKSADLNCPFSAGTGTYQTVAAISGGVLYVRYFATNGASLGNFAKNVIRRIVIQKTGHIIVYDDQGEMKAEATSLYRHALDGVDTTLSLFARRNYSLGFSGRIYGFSITNNEVEKVYLIPCVRKSDSKPGMYDTVTKTFFTNAGTGEFIVPA